MSLRAAPFKRLSVFLFLVVLLVPSLIWILQDRSVWPWDQAWYGEVTVDLWYWLSRLLHPGALHEWKRALLAELYLKPPGTVWFGQFFLGLRGIFGTIESALLFSIWLTQFLTLLLLYRIGVTVFRGSRLPAVLGVIVAAGGQLFVGLSHQYIVEPLQTLAATWVFLVAVRSRSWPRAKILLHLSAATILGLLAKTTTVMYCFAACLYIVVIFLRRRELLDFRGEVRSWSSRLVLSFCLVFGLLGLLWYKRNFHLVLQHFHDATGASALDYGYRAPLGEKLATWLGLFAREFLCPYLWWAGVLVLVLLILSLWLGAKRGKLSDQDPLVVPLIAICLVQIALVLLVFSLNVVIETRYLLALVPSVAILFMSLSSLTRWRPALVAVIAIAIVQWAVVNGFAAGVIQSLPDRGLWLLIVNRDARRYNEVTRLVRITSTRNNAYNIVGIEEPWLNANSVDFFAAKRRLTTDVRSYYTSLGYAQKDTRAALARIEEFHAPYVVTLAASFQNRPPNFLNQVSLPVLKELEQDKQFTRLPFASQEGILVFQRLPAATVTGLATDPVAKRAASQ